MSGVCFPVIFVYGIGVKDYSLPEVWGEVWTYRNDNFRFGFVVGLILLVGAVITIRARRLIAKSSTAGRGMKVTPLMQAAEEGRVDVAKALLDEGAEVDARSEKGLAALMIAAVAGHEDIAKLLLQKAADINATDPDEGRTPLIIAAMSGHVGMVDLLVKHGADLTGKQSLHKSSPLIMASALGQKDIVRILLDHGADVNAQDARYGYSALMMAAMEGHDEVVQLLLDNGADINAKSKDGKTTLSSILKSKAKKARPY